MGCGISQCLGAYCDDINILTNHISDFYVLDSAVRKFEAVSGAILSRDKKCKVLGLGTWKDRMIWPLDYLKCVKEVKVFGIFILDSYRSLLKRNWDFRFEKFWDVVKSWSSRVLDTLFQRVEVLKVFALSRVYYVASILPINKTMVKKFEKEMGKFLWIGSGKILRVSLEELKNFPEQGGLGLPCVVNRCEALLLSQLLRLLKSNDKKSIGHVGYWLGELLGDLVMGIDGGVHATEVPAYFDHLGHLLVEAKACDLVTEGNWKTLTNKAIYLHHAESFPVPKVEVEAGISFKTVWQRILSPVLSASARDVLYLLVHNKLPIQERMFRIRLALDPYCEYCPDAVICDVEHFFCLCSRVSHVWNKVRAMLLSLSGSNVRCSDWKMINLLFAQSNSDREGVWLVGTYVAKVWEDLCVRGGTRLREEQFFGFLTFKYKLAQEDGPGLRVIPGLIS